MKYKQHGSLTTSKGKDKIYQENIKLNRKVYNNHTLSENQFGTLISVNTVK